MLINYSHRPDFWQILFSKIVFVSFHSVAADVLITKLSGGFSNESLNSLKHSFFNSNFCSVSSVVAGKNMETHEDVCSNVHT